MILVELKLSTLMKKKFKDLLIKKISSNLHDISSSQKIIPEKESLKLISSKTNKTQPINLTQKKLILASLPLKSKIETSFIHL
jgi:hypothetical protein